MLLRKMMRYTVSSIREAVAKHCEVRLRKRLHNKTEYVFTTDYVTSVAPLWKEYIGGFGEKEGIRLLEIGSYEGRSSIWFLENILTHPTASMTCIDIFSRKYEPLFDHNIKVSGFSEKVTKIKGFSERLLPTLKRESFDIIYIDGSHLAPTVLMDAVVSWFLLRPDGIMIFDDYEWEPDKPPERRPKMAIDLFLNVFEGHIRVLHKGYQVIISKSNTELISGEI